MDTPRINARPARIFLGCPFIMANWDIQFWGSSYKVFPKFCMSDFFSYPIFPTGERGVLWMRSIQQNARRGLRRDAIRKTVFRERNAARAARRIFSGRPPYTISVYKKWGSSYMVSPIFCHSFRMMKACLRFFIPCS